MAVFEGGGCVGGGKWFAIDGSEAQPDRHRDAVELAPGVLRIRMTLAGTKTVAIDTGTLEDLAGQVSIGDPSVGQPIRHLTLIDRR